MGTPEDALARRSRKFHRSKSARVAGGAGEPGDPDDWTPRKHAPGAIALALIPFVTMCFSVALWDRVSPMVLGLPFNLFWLASWEVLSVGCLALAYRLESAHARRKNGAHDGRVE